jgi:hypothetical protein
MVVVVLGLLWVEAVGASIGMGAASPLKLKYSVVGEHNLLPGDNGAGLLLLLNFCNGGGNTKGERSKDE